MARHPSHGDVSSAQPPNLSPNSSPNINHRAFGFAAIFLAFFVGFHMVLMVCDNAKKRQSIFKNLRDCFQLRSGSGLYFAFEGGSYGLYDDGVDVIVVNSLS